MALNQGLREQLPVSRAKFTSLLEPEPEAPEVKAPRSVSERILAFGVPCIECKGEIPRRFLIPYRGRLVCPACFLNATEAARKMARKRSVPLFMRARKYLETSGRNHTATGCNCGD